MEESNRSLVYGFISRTSEKMAGFKGDSNTGESRGFASHIENSNRNLFSEFGSGFPWT